jgi:hypothetical protein
MTTTTPKFDDPPLQPAAAAAERSCAIDSVGMTDAQRAHLWASFERGCLESSTQVDGWRFNRDEANVR